MGGSSVPLQRSSAEDFIAAESFEGAGGNSCDGNGVADGVEDFNGVSSRPIEGNVAGPPA